MYYKHFILNIKAMKNNVNYKLSTFDRQAVIDDIDNLIRQLKITKDGISGALTSNYECKHHAAEWLFMDSRNLDGIIKTLTSGGYDHD